MARDRDLMLSAVVAKPAACRVDQLRLRGGERRSSRRAGGEGPADLLSAAEQRAVRCGRKAAPDVGERERERRR